MARSKYDFFAAASGINSSLPEMELVALQVCGATSNQLNEAWLEFMTEQGFSSGSLNDRQYRWLRSRGFNGSLSDMFYQLYQEEGGAPFDPEDGLTLTSEHAVDTVVNLTGPQRAGNFTVAMDFTGLDGSTGGLIWEQGGTTIGAFVGFRANGDFIFRIGSGAAPWNAGTAYIQDSSGTVAGDGTLVVEGRTGSTGQVRAWWNGVPIGTPVDSSTSVANWAGSDAGAFLRSSGSMVIGELSTPLESPGQYTTVSTLRFYDSEVTATGGGADNPLCPIAFQGYVVDNYVIDGYIV